MKRPWQIWAAFLLALAVMIPGMAMLTLRAVELDRSEAMARAEADLESRIGSALWRMDTWLTRVLAPEIGRPYFVYEPFLSDGGKQRAPSPLLGRTSRFVRLHFQADANAKQWTSPQVPAGSDVAMALANGATGDQLLRSKASLEVFSCDVPAGVLCQLLPDDTIQSLDETEPAQLAETVSNPAVEFANRNSPAPTGMGMGRARRRPAEAGQSGDEAYPASPRQTAGQQTAGNPPSDDLNDLRNRVDFFQSEAAQQRRDQGVNTAWVQQVQGVHEGIAKPVWFGDKLLVARRVWFGDRQVVQGCWLDWDALCVELRERVMDLLPEFEFQPAEDVEQINVNHVLATLPAQIVAPQPALPPLGWTPIRVALAAAWTLLVLAAGGVALVLQGVVSLSERRAAFVSAVTHELRTPLTTFKMYSEMLAAGMVPDPKRQQEYLETLRAESHRLSHLVDNVLQYARLERSSSTRRSSLRLSELVHRVAPRLQERAERAERSLMVRDTDLDAPPLEVLTDPGAVEQILFNLVDNACKYAWPAESAVIDLVVTTDSKGAVLEVRDYGPGLSLAARKELFRPFSKSAEQAAESAPGVGLGLALCKRLAKEIGGDLTWEPRAPGAGFRLRLPAPSRAAGPA